MAEAERSPDVSTGDGHAAASKGAGATGGLALLASGGWRRRALVAVAGIAVLSVAYRSFDLGSLLAQTLPPGDARAMPKDVAFHDKGHDKVKKAQAIPSGYFKPTEAHWQTLTTEPVKTMKFRELVGTDGKIAINEDRTTPVFSPYAGRVVKLMVKQGDHVEIGTPLFTIDAVDMVQGQNDYLAATAAVNKARSAVQLADKTYTRNKNLVDAKAAAVKDLQTAEDQLNAARNDLKTAEATLGAARNRLLILGKTASDIDNLASQGRITAETVVYAPIAGTIVSRKVGPGQYIATGVSDPAFVIGDLSTVWLVANVRESDAPKVRPGQTIEFSTLAIADRTFSAQINYVSTAVDPATRRLQVRAEIANPDMALKPEMFASVSIACSGTDEVTALPRTALIYEGNDVRVWVARADRTIELRKIKVGLTTAEMAQVLKGVDAGESVITKGGLFIDRIAKAKD